MGVRYFQVDAFTETPFAGNPAGVCLLDDERDSRWMQAVAREMNLSETAFPRPQGELHELRWFTPAVEVDLCGHATLATAHVLWEEGVLGRHEEAKFSTRSGLLVARWDDGRIAMDFPAIRETPAQVTPELVRALGTDPLYVGKSRFDLIVLLPDEDAVRALAPRLDLVEALPVRGIIVTARAASPDFDFVSRFFGPAVGVPEDPVTGSAHCVLGPFWQTHTGKTTFRALQVSRRGGIVDVEVGDGRVVLGGRAVTVVRGELLA